MENCEIKCRPLEKGMIIAVDITALDKIAFYLIYKGCLKPLEIKEVKTKMRHIPFIKKKRKIVTFEVINPNINEEN